MSITTVRNLKSFLERSNAQGMECYAWVEAHAFVKAMLADLEKPAAPVAIPEEHGDDNVSMEP